MERHVFIIGSKGIPANYGGFETFVDKLTEYRVDESIKYHVACMNAKEKRFEYHNADCFSVKVPEIGPAKAIYYDVKALKECIAYCRTNNIENPIIYVLACRIGPFFANFRRKVHKLGGELYLNPDGHEWKRKKWKPYVRAYWKYSERLMVKSADLIICDSLNIEKYIQTEYAKYKPNTTFIAYGTELESSTLSTEDRSFLDYLEQFHAKPNEYYLVVGRFVPENNFYTMIKEYLLAKTEKKLLIITTPNEKFENELEEKLHFREDDRIVFAGTLYDQNLLKKVREEAFAYLHGHEVGGTNPSLLEALGSTKLNLLMDVCFNREVAESSAVYFDKSEGSLSKLIEEVEGYSASEIENLSNGAKKRVKEFYSWNYIVNLYEKIWLKK